MLRTCTSNSYNIDCFFKSLQILKITKSSICIAYTMNILGICHVYTRYFCDEVLKENCAFLTISGFNITLSLSMAMVYSIELHINTWKWNFDIHSIYMVYTMYIQPLGIYMVYTWYIPTIYLIGVPDVHLEGCAIWYHIWYHKLMILHMIS